MKTFIIAETHTTQEMYAMLEYIGAKDWSDNYNFGEIQSAAEFLVEVCGRMCYKSFGIELNKNLTRVREGNYEYIGQGILKTKHGSVIEHPSTTVAILGASRIFTHELVRHRAGVAISQESQRFVRLDEFDVYIPNLDNPLDALVRHLNPELKDKQVKEDVAALAQEYMDIVEDVKGYTQSKLKGLTKYLDSPGLSFEVKKQITSALRRFIPGGVNTNIIVTANHRAWRHMIAMRTAPGAEIEIREVFADIAGKFRTRYPALYQDMVPAGHLEYTFQNEKV